jgi:Ser/Thr protein kinase RdoA (MazF antagonist)
MHRIEDLPRSTQIRRMRRLAQTALAAYDLEQARITPLQHFLNTTFRIDIPYQGQRYVLRISRAGYQDAATIRSELLWLQAIRRETDLVVPEPLFNRDGLLLTTVEVPGIPEPRHCVLFHWVDGRFHRTRLCPTDLERVGMMMAKLHLHVQRFTLPQGFARKRWDLAGLQGGALGIDPEKSRQHLSREECCLLDKIAERVGQTMQTLGEGSEVFGLIHADIHQWNYLFLKGNVHLIDFDTSGWGYFAYDMAVTFSTLLHHPNLLALRTAFLQGYKQVRPLPVEQEDCIDTFVVARIFGHTQWLAAHIGEPAFGNRAAVRVAQQLDELRNWLDQ